MCESKAIFITPTLTIFLAGSTEELGKERRAVARQIKKINEDISKRNQYIDLISSENLTKKKQQHFNDKIRFCHVFIVLLGGGIGPYTKKECEIAWQIEEVTTRPPEIIVYAMRESLLHTTGQNKIYAESRSQFKEKCSVRGDYFIEFNNAKKLENKVHDLIFYYLNNPAV